MIFRIDGEVGELLALTPIIREWRQRNKRERVFVETNTPEIFYGNPDVEVAEYVILDTGLFYDMNMVRWRERGIAVEEVYAEVVLGDKNFKDWKPFMASRPDDIDHTKQFKSQITHGKPVAVVAFNKMIDSNSADETIRAVEEDGYVIDCVSGLSAWSLVRSHIDEADIFIGEDGDEAAIALTTKTPAIVCYSYRSPAYFPPFRRDIPFRALVPDRSLCEHAPVCHARNSHVQFAKCYSQGCVDNKNFCCRKRSLMKEVLEAIRSIGDKA